MFEGKTCYKVAFVVASEGPSPLIRALYFADPCFSSPSSYWPPSRRRQQVSGQHICEQQTLRRIAKRISPRKIPNELNSDCSSSHSYDL